jgi:hypothetical protein
MQMLQLISAFVRLENRLSRAADNERGFCRCRIVEAVGDLDGHRVLAGGKAGEVNPVAFTGRVGKLSFWKDHLPLAGIQAVTRARHRRG